MGNGPRYSKYAVNSNLHCQDTLETETQTIIESSLKRMIVSWLWAITHTHLLCIILYDIILRLPGPSSTGMSFLYHLMEGRGTPIAEQGSIKILLLFTT